MLKQATVEKNVAGLRWLFMFKALVGKVVREGYKILGTIVFPLPVYVVNCFRGAQRPPDQSPYNKAMLEYISSLLARLQNLGISLVVPDPSVPMRMIFSPDFLLHGFGAMLTKIRLSHFYFHFFGNDVAHMRFTHALASFRRYYSSLKSFAQMLAMFLRSRPIFMPSHSFANSLSLFGGKMRTFFHVFLSLFNYTLIDRVCQSLVFSGPVERPAPENKFYLGGA